MATWIITGANRGIGLELCTQLAARGDTVIGTARDPAAASALRALPVAIEALDLRDDASVRALGRRLEDRAIDVLVNNAGRGGGGPGIAELDWDIVGDYFAVNAIGPMRVTQALLPALRRGERRLVAHLSSNLGSIGDNHSGGSYAYRASKAALNMFNRSLAHELAPEGFTCLVLHPGWVQTDMGGPRATTPVADSVAGLLEVMDGAGPEKTGRFISFRGDQLTW